MKDKDYNWRKTKSIVTYDESGKFPVSQRFELEEEWSSDLFKNKDDVTRKKRRKQ